MVDHTTTPFQIRRDRHYDLMSGLNAELRGVIQAVGEAVDAGHITAEQALSQIREKATKTEAAIEASWGGLLAGVQ